MSRVEEQSNRHAATVAGFGDEWTRFDQASLSDAERLQIFEDYFAIFPQDILNHVARGADFGVGSGRWAAVIAPKVGRLVCVDASSDALAVARETLGAYENCEFHHASLNSMDIPDRSLDFAYSLGVLHHIPDPLAAMKACVEKLKPGAPFLVYVYYRFDNRPIWFRSIWGASNVVRMMVSRTPHPIRYGLSQIIAALVYWPLARGARLLEKTGARVAEIPLAYYRDKSFYVMRTDALDRFGTQLEHRFTKAEIEQMMVQSGLTNVRFNQSAPFWCAVGWKR